MERALGPTHRGVLPAISDLALVLEGQGKYAEREKLLQRKLAIHEGGSAIENAEVCETLERLTFFDEKQVRCSQAAEGSERANNGFSETPSEQELTTLECIRRLKLLREQQLRSERTSQGQVDVEQDANIVNHRRSHGVRPFSWLNRERWFPRNRRNGRVRDRDSARPDSHRNGMK
ncbi:unnamed protein product [Tuber aestivum]|uniref:Uncharacterized protein n=1 Tax=Tuber aestivum TaxID=59557 RepID=A0A292Q0Q9_9PEZI|nr:unnamed protein product [Tuber aestivum]